MTFKPGLMITLVRHLLASTTETAFMAPEKTSMTIMDTQDSRGRRNASMTTPTAINGISAPTIGSHCKPVPCAIT